LRPSPHTELTNASPVALFGLAVSGLADLAPLAAAPSGNEPCVSYLEVDPLTLRRSFDRERATRVSMSRNAAGDLAFFIDRDPQGRLELWGRSYGRCVVDPEGRSVAATPAADRARWREFLLGQVLPICAVLRGLEVFHASAVVTGGSAVAFAAPAGVGKTSVAMRSVLAGATLLTDDVLALSLGRDGRLMAHPGAPVLSLRDPEHRSLAAHERARLGGARPRGDGRVTYDVAVHRGPVPLRAVCFIERVREGEGVSYAPAHEPRLLLGSSFVFVVQDGQRLERQLDLCARIAATTRLVRVQVPPQVDARALAHVLEGATP
jgi:hypothetical protein